MASVINALPFADCRTTPNLKRPVSSMGILRQDPVRRFHRETVGCNRRCHISKYHLANETEPVGVRAAFNGTGMERIPSWFPSCSTDGDVLIGGDLFRYL